MKMMSYRGINITDVQKFVDEELISVDESPILDLDKQDVPEFLALFPSTTSMNSIYTDVDGTKILVVYIVVTSKSVGRSELNPYVISMMESTESIGVRTTILITNVPMSSQASKEFFEPAINQTRQHFLFSELTRSLPESPLVPRMFVTSDEEVRKLARRLNLITSDGAVHLEKLPKMFHDDAAAKYYGFKIGQVIKIHGRDLGIGLMVPVDIRYRLVVIKENERKLKKVRLDKDDLPIDVTESETVPDMGLEDLDF